VVCSCEYDNELSGFIKSSKILGFIANVRFSRSWFVGWLLIHCVIQVYFRQWTCPYNCHAIQPPFTNIEKIMYLSRQLYIPDILHQKK
jgi:hypothetical protein